MELIKASFSLDDPERLWAYCGQDCAVTAGVANRLLPMLSDNAEGVYAFEKACMATAATMMLRGIRVDKLAVIDELNLIRRDCFQIIKRLPEMLAKSAREGRGQVPSPAILGKYLYGELKLPKMYNRRRQVSTERECLQRLAVKCPDQEDLINDIFTLRELDKDRQTLERGIDADGRLRGGWSVGATETGRWSCSENPMGTGGNLQNIRHRLRKIFVPDTGFTMVYADLAQAESRTVAYRSGDENYIRSHLEGDTHINVARLLWPELPWSGDDKQDRAEIGDKPADFGPNHSWRDWSKREQHAFNYMQTFYGAARTLRISQATAKKHQKAYFSSFPGIPEWHDYVCNLCKTEERMVSQLGRERQFLGRTWDKATWREAVSNEPQGIVGDIINMGGVRIWDKLEPRVQLLANGHDAWLFQAKSDKDIRKAVELMQIAVEMQDIHGTVRTMVIPADFNTGDNWADIS